MSKKILLAIILVVGVLFGQQNVEKNKSKKPPQEFTLGTNLFQGGDIKGAIELWKKALEKDSTLAPAWFNMATAYDMLHQDSIALECYKKAAIFDNDDADPWIYMAQIYRRQKDYQNTKICYENAIDRKDDDPELYNSLAIVYDQLGDYKSALTVLDKAIQLDTVYLSAMVNKLVVYNHAEKYDSVISFGYKVVSLFPDEPVSWVQLGVAYHYIGRNDSALWAVDSALAIYSDLASAHYYKGLILLAQKKDTEALNEIGRAIELVPDYRDIAAQDGELEPIKNTKQFRDLIKGK